MKTIIKNGHILNPATNMDEIADICIEDGIITKIEKNIEEDADEVILAEGKYVMPGFIDLHVHFREPGFEYKETIKTGSRAAARGGFTSVCPMPNTNPVIDSKEMIEYLLQKEKTDSLIHIVPVGAVTKGQAGAELADIQGMADAGAKALSEDGKSVMDVLVYVEGMKKARENNLVVLAHCEDKNLVRGGVMNAGARAEELGLKGITNAVEDVIAARDIFLAQEAGAKLHLCHCSTKDSVSLIKMAKEQGYDVTGEVCPHHFTMCDEEILSDDGNYKMNPPLRSRADVLALKEGLRDGIIDVIATDHAPHSAEEKAKSIAEAPFGIVGLETAFALAVTELVKTGYLTPMQLVEKMSYNPAKVLGIDKGNLDVGKVADLVIADFDASYKIKADKFVSMGKNTPFDGKKVSGKILKTLVDGKMVYQIINRKQKEMMDKANKKLSVEDARERLHQYLAEQTGWKYLKSRRCLKKVINDLVFEINFYYSHWNYSYESIQVNCALSMWSKKLDKTLNVKSSVGGYFFEHPEHYYYDITTEAKLSQIMELLATKIKKYAITLADKFEEDYLGAVKSLLDDEIFDRYGISLEYIALHLGNEFVRNKAKEIYEALDDNWKQQMKDYKQGDRSKNWMINPSNLKYILDNDLIDI